LEVCLSNMASAEIKAGTNLAYIYSYRGAWTTIRNGLDTLLLRSQSAYSPTVGVLQTSFTEEFDILRCFLQFDLSSISPGTIIPSASLKLYCIAHSGSVAMYAVITKGHQSDPLVIGDFDTAEPYTQRDEVTNRGQKQFGDFSPYSGYIEIDFNADGLSMIEAACGGTLLLCLRASPDVDDAEGQVPAVGASNLSFGKSTVEGQEPYLLIPEYYFAKYPSHNLTRVTGIRHIYRPGSYRLEATLGDVSTSIELPQRDIQIPTVVPAKAVKPEKAIPLRVPEKTAPELIEALREEGLLPEAGASADITALEPLPIRAGILERIKPLSREDLERLGTIIGQEAPPEPSLWQRLTPWKEERDETFGTAFTSTFRRGFEEVAKLGESYKKFFGGLFG